MSVALFIKNKIFHAISDTEGQYNFEIALKSGKKYKSVLSFSKDKYFSNSTNVSIAVSE